MQLPALGRWVSERKAHAAATLETRDLARARKKAMVLESDETKPHKPVMDAVKDFLEHCKSESLTGATIKKYRDPLMKLAAFCDGENIDSLDESGRKNWTSSAPVGRSS